MAEAGVRGFELGGWFGIFLPAKASPEITQYLSNHVKMAVNDPGTVEFMRSIGAEPLPGSAADLANIVTTDTANWGRITKLANIQPE
jgi:tripartite-type tricarboxylate transporter receptor subunit TctC